MPGVQIPAFGRTKQNPSEEGQGEAAQDHQEEIPPSRIQGRGTGDSFAWCKQTDESESSKAAPSGPPPQPEQFCLDQPKTISAAARTDDKEPDNAEIQHDSCSEVAPSLRTPSPPDNDSDNASLFKTILCAGGSTGISTSIPSGGTASNGEQDDNVAEEGGNVGEQDCDLGEQDCDLREHSTGGADSVNEHVEEEPLENEPSLIREKDKEKTPPEHNNAYSVSPPHLGHQKI